MKHLITPMLFLLTLGASAQVTDVLFVGNSFTGSNGMPEMLYELALSKGDTMGYESSTPQTATLDQHSTNLTTIDLMNDGGWEHIIIQEQGQLPIFALGEVETTVFEPATEIIEYARQFSECCMPIFFMTWGYEDGDTENCEDVPEACTYDGMTQLLSDRYMQMAQENNCWVAPIGEAWKYCRQITNDTIPLYEVDGYSPSLAGSYLTACVLYASIWGENPMGSVYYGGLPDDDGYLLQTVANQIVLEQNDDWNFISYLDAELFFTIGDPFTTVDVETSIYVDSILVNYDGQIFNWQNGDGSSLILGEGTHYFEVEIYSNCVNEIGFFLDSLVIDGDVGIDQLQRQYQLYPNPFDSEIRIDGINPGTLVKMVDITGREVQCGKDYLTNSVRLMTSDLPVGTYFVILGDARNTKAIKVMKN
jgi:hypothetical protein